MMRYDKLNHLFAAALVFVLVVAIFLAFGCAAVSRTVATSLLDAADERLKSEFANATSVAQLGRELSEVLSLLRNLLWWLLYGVVGSTGSVILHRYFYHGHLDRPIAWFGRLIFGKRKSKGQ